MRFVIYPLLGVVTTSLLFGCAGSTPVKNEPAPAAVAEKPSPDKLEIAPDIAKRLARLPRTLIDYDRSLLTDSERKVVDKLIEASRLIDEVFLQQVDEDNPRTRAQLQALAATAPAYAEALELFDVMKGRWDQLDADAPFVAPFGEAGKLPKGAGFYPKDMTREEFEAFIAAHPAEKDAFQGLFTVIQRDPTGGLKTVPFATHYRAKLEPAAAALREAAALTDNASLKKYLSLRAEALLTDDYYASDVAWMDLDSSIEVVIGPYEVYTDGLLNLKAAYESFVTVVDRPASDELKVFASHLADMERALPIPDQYKNPARGGESPIKVVQEIFTSGDTRRGVQTAAFNLPNDERVREAKGSKKVLLKNVMEAKFNTIGKHIAARVLEPGQTDWVSFDAFFTHILFHEMAHGLGPGFITLKDGTKAEARIPLKELYSSIEEAKADVLGMYCVLWALDKKLIHQFTAEQLFATNAGMLYRSMRFGLHEAHGAGTVAQWNFYREKGAIVPGTEGHFKVVPQAMVSAIRALTEELLMIEATGDYARAKALLERYGQATEEIERVVKDLEHLPVDISPVYVAAGEK